MIISHKYKFIFIKTLKTAGTSIEVYLSDVCATDDVVTPVYPEEATHVPRNFKGRWNVLSEILSEEQYGKRRSLRDWFTSRKFYNHLPARIARHRIDQNIWNNYFKFTVERNPWDKTLSDFYMKKDRSGGNLTFQDYLARGVFCRNQPIYCDVNGNILVDRIIRYENLSQELGEVFGELGVPFDGELNVSAKAGHRKDRRSYQEVFDDKERKLIEKAFSSEIEMHGYSF